MIRHPWILPSLAAALGVAFTVYAGATMYTASGRDTLPSRAVRSLIRDALDQTHPPLPSVGAFLALQPADAASAPDPRARRRQVMPTYSDAARRWAERNVQADSSGLRTWLGSHVRVTAQTRADTMDLVMRRFTVHRGCPWLNTLRATFARPPGGPYHLVRVRSTCPALGSG